MVHCSDFYGWRSPLPDEKCNESLRQELKQDFEKFANLKTSGADSFKSNDIIFLLNNENRKLNDNDLTESGRFSRQEKLDSYLVCTEPSGQYYI